MAEFRPRGFQILPPVVKNLLIINGLVFLAEQVFPNLINMFALHYWGSNLFKPYQLVTHMFMHGSIGHIFFNMFALWMFGSILENYFGPKRFLIFYMVCGLGAAICYLLVLTLRFHYMVAQAGLSTTAVQQMWYKYSHNISGAFGTLPANIQQVWLAPTLGASGAIFGLLVAFGYLFPDSRIYVYFLLPIKAKYFVIFYIIAELYFGFQNSPGDNVAHFAHLGGALVGFIMLKIWGMKSQSNY